MVTNSLKSSWFSNVRGDVLAGIVVALALAVVGLLESLMTAQIVDELTDTTSDQNREAHGQIFFASADSFAAGFDFKEVIAKVVIDVSLAHFWDLTSVGALDKVVLKFRREGAEVEILGMNEASATIVGKLALHDKRGALERLLEH